MCPKAVAGPATNVRGAMKLGFSALPLSQLVRYQYYRQSDKPDPERRVCNESKVHPRPVLCRQPVGIHNGII